MPNLWRFCKKWLLVDLKRLLSCMAPKTLPYFSFLIISSQYKNMDFEIVLTINSVWNRLYIDGDICNICYKWDVKKMLVCCIQVYSLFCASQTLFCSVV